MLAVLNNCRLGLAATLLDELRKMDTITSAGNIYPSLKNQMLHCYFRIFPKRLVWFRIQSYDVERSLLPLINFSTLISIRVYNIHIFSFPT